jgi:drug/metabolite transporter (DMT)-like permease
LALLFVQTHGRFIPQQRTARALTFFDSRIFGLQRLDEQRVIGFIQLELFAHFRIAHQIVIDNHFTAARYCGGDSLVRFNGENGHIYFVAAISVILQGCFLLALSLQLLMINHRLTFSTALLLTIAPLLWAGNAIVGRLVVPMVPPLTLNFLRWGIAFLILLPLAASVFRSSSGLWTHWRRYALLGLLGVGLYNSLQYLALQSSTPINVTLVASGMPVWMMLTGALFFGARIARRQVLGAALSVLGVLLVLSRGDWRHLLELRLVPGDVLMILATIAWSLYSWLLTRPGDAPDVRSHWVSFLMAQVGFGLLWSGAFAAGEWAVVDAQIHWSWPLAGALLYVAVGPALIAFRCWGAGVQRAGPSVAAFFSNLTPLFAALMSAAFLGELPQVYHGIAFLLIVGGIVVSTRLR